MDQTESRQKSRSDSRDQFADLLDSYEPIRPRQGQYLTGKIVSIDTNMILADVGAKRTAIVPPQDIANVDNRHLEELAAGDEIVLYVTQTPRGEEDLEVSFDRGLQYQDWIAAKALLESKAPVELLICGHNGGGLIVQFNSLRGFIPNSHLPNVQNLNDKQQRSQVKAQFVGSMLSVKAIEVDSSRRRLVFSAKHLKDERRKQRLLALKELEGEIIVGKISKLVDYGAFVSLDGAEGLLHISEIAWHSVKKPADVLAVGESLELLILSVDLERHRISLSRKALISNPFEQVAAQYQLGDLVEATITNVVDFGAFATILPGAEGLIHISEMYVERNAHPQEAIAPGDKVLTRIVRLQPERERIGLSQRQVSEQEEIEWIWQQQQIQLSDQ